MEVCGWGVEGWGDTRAASVPCNSHLSLNCSSLSFGTPVKVNPTQDSLFSMKRGLICTEQHSSH